MLAAALALTGCTKKNDDLESFRRRCGHWGEFGPGAGGAKDKVAFVPKLQGMPYFEAMNAGGNRRRPSSATSSGSTRARPRPTRRRRPTSCRYIQQKVDTLFIAPNDPDSMAPLLQQAKDAGINVGTADTDAPNSVREAFVLGAAQGIGEGTPTR